MEQQIADSKVVEIKIKEQEEWYSHSVSIGTFAGIQRVSDRDRFGEFTGRKEFVRVYRRN